MLDAIAETEGCRNCRRMGHVFRHNTANFRAYFRGWRALAVWLGCARLMVGYSGTPLPQKLGLKPRARFGVWAPPKGFVETLGALPEGVTMSDAARGSAALDVIVCFVASRVELERRLPRAQRRLDPQGGLWVCWPKKASGVATDVTESDVRRLGLGCGLVDNKVCAVDEVWSGLRLVVRLKDRPRSAPPARAVPPKTSRKTTKSSRTSPAKR